MRPSQKQGNLQDSLPGVGAGVTDLPCHLSDSISEVRTSGVGDPEKSPPKYSLYGPSNLASPSLLGVIDTDVITGVEVDVKT